jgi:hypothetical protein
MVKYRVTLGCYGEREVESEDEAYVFIRQHYSEGVIFSMEDVDDLAIGESPIYETDLADGEEPTATDLWAVGTIYRKSDRNCPTRG